MNANGSTDLELMRASLLLETDPAAAARSAREVLAGSPEHSQASLLLAAAYRKLGQSAEAARVLERLARAAGDSAVLYLELGRARAAAGQHVEARAALRKAVDLNPELADGWRNLAEEHFIAGDMLAGDAAYREYIRLTPRHPPELNDAVAALAANRLRSAQSLLEERIRQAPADVVALRMLADVLTRREDYVEAERQLRHCLELAPGYAAARYDLARVLHAQNRELEVLPLVERLLATEPRNIDCLYLKAQAMRLVGRHAEAVALMKQAVEDQPDVERVWLLYGHLLREVGRSAEAIDMYRRALTVRPGCGRAYSSLANLKTFRFSAAETAAMQAHLAAVPARGADRIHLEFALAKALEDEGRYGESFEHYASGNALQREKVAHDPDAFTAEVRRSKALYTADFFARRSGWGSGSREPIFIVGLPRSGSTLLEQILASHSQVEGTRELTDIPAIALEVSGRAGATRTYPEPVASLTGNELERLALRYLAQTRIHRPLGRPRFIDKMLGNFSHVGLIQLMFPKAAIIDARRHPLGCGFSCYKQLFARGLGFTYDLRELGGYYRDYAELMAHWDEALPGRVHRVSYERLVSDPEGELRRLLEYCDLPYEAQCLRYHENPRIVQTISSEQVRRPIYTEGVDHWRHYEPWLGPLKEAVGDWLDRYPLP